MRVCQQNIRFMLIEDILLMENLLGGFRVGDFNDLTVLSEKDGLKVHIRCQF